MRRLRSSIVLADSITAIPPGTEPRLVVCGSHGGIFSAQLALRLNVSAVMFSDAGLGRDEAGVAGVRWLDAFGIPAAAVSHLSARIGDAGDLVARGVISVVNDSARSRGVREGMSVAKACLLLKSAPRKNPTPAQPEVVETRHWLRAGAGVRVVAVDSNSLVRADDAGAIVVTGSHGGLLGGNPQTAIKHSVVAAFYNDAGVGIDCAGIGRLPALDARGIAGVAVHAFSARIGDSMSTYNDGIVSHVNSCAARLDVQPGMPVVEAVDLLFRHQRSNQCFSIHPTT